MRFTYDDQVQLSSSIGSFEAYRVDTHNTSHQAPVFRACHVSKVSVGNALKTFHFVLVDLLEEKTTIGSFVKCGPRLAARGLPRIAFG